mgnify:FL=1
MPIAYRAAATVTEFGGSTSVVCNRPTGVVSGDVMVAFVFIYDNPAGAVTGVPSGWTEITQAQQFQVSRYQRAYYKVAGGSEPASYTWTVNNLDTVNIGIVAYSGVDNATPLDATSTSSSGTSANRTATGLTTATDNAWLVLGSTGSQNPSAGPSGMTNRATWTGHTVIYDQAITPAGATGNKVITTAADTNGWTTALIALRPASGGAGAAPQLMLMGVG